MYGYSCFASAPVLVFCVFQNQIQMPPLIRLPEMPGMQAMFSPLRNMRVSEDWLRDRSSMEMSCGLEKSLHPFPLQFWPSEAMIEPSAKKTREVRR